MSKTKQTHDTFRGPNSQITTLIHNLTQTQGGSYQVLVSILRFSQEQSDDHQDNETYIPSFDLARKEIHCKKPNDLTLPQNM